MTLELQVEQKVMACLHESKKRFIIEFIAIIAQILKITRKSGFFIHFLKTILPSIAILKKAGA